MSKKWTLEQEVGIYAKYVGWIDREEYNWETFAWEALIIRSGLAERWEELTESLRQQIAVADDLLVANHQRMQEILPGAGVHPVEEWWWYIDEGPAVRERAKKL